MNIVQINVFDRQGSTGRTCYELQQYINNQTEHRCYTAYAIGSEIEYGYRVGSWVGHKFHALLARMTGRQGFFSKKETRKLIRFLDKVQPDIVHLRNLHSNYVDVRILLDYLAKKDIACVVTLHDCWFFTGGCCHYTLDGCYKWQSLCGECPRRRADKSWFFDATRKNYIEKKRLLTAIPRLAVIGVSDWITDEAKQSFLKDSKKVARIYNWIDLNTFSRTQEKRNELTSKYPRQKLLLSVASYWNASKGIVDFIELAKHLGDGYRILLIGTMEYDGQLPSNITSVGPLNEKSALAQYYSAADVFINLSLQETFGKVSAEAIACGTPVITVDSTANGEIVEDGCGVVLPEINVSLISEAVVQICKSGYGAFADACRASAKKRFNPEILMNEYIDLYQELAQNTQKG